MKQASRATRSARPVPVRHHDLAGTLPVIGYLALLTFALVFSAALVLAITGTAINEDEHPGLGEAFWQSLLRILDPGTFSGDNGWFLRVVMLIVTLIGISIAAVLIGLIASGIEQRIELLRRGRSAVVETGHTLILGWSPRMHTVVSELCTANENQRRPAIVVLANEDKQEMEDDLAGRIGDTKGTRVVCRTGDPASLHDLRMASAGSARSIIVLGAGDVASDADAAVVRSVLAVLHVVEDPATPIVAEVDDAETSWALREASNGRLLTVRSSDVIARITAQACRQSGLSAVCQELLDFDGDEIYFRRVPELTGHTFGEALLAFETSTVIGVRHADGTVTVNPPMGTVIGGRRRRDRDLCGRRHDHVLGLPRRADSRRRARASAAERPGAAARRRMEPARPGGAPGARRLRGRRVDRGRHRRPRHRRAGRAARISASSA